MGGRDQTEKQKGLRGKESVQRSEKITLQDIFAIGSFSFATDILGEFFIKIITMEHEQGSFVKWENVKEISPGKENIVYKQRVN